MQGSKGIPEGEIRKVAVSICLMYLPIEAQIGTVNIVKYSWHLEGAVQGGIKNPLLLFGAPPQYG